MIDSFSESAAQTAPFITCSVEARECFQQPGTSYLQPGCEISLTTKLRLERALSSESRMRVLVTVPASFSSPINAR